MGRRLALAMGLAAGLAAAGALGYVVGYGTSHARVKTVRVGPSGDELARQYAVGQANGKQAGELDGYGRGYRAGMGRAREIVHRAVSNAASDAFDAGARAVFDGFGSPWHTGAYYVVRIDPGGNVAPYAIGARLQMDPADYYDLCPSSGDLCGGPWSNITAAITGSGSSSSALDAGTINAPDTGNVGFSEPTYPVVCTDGWISPSGGHQGACSHHGGEL